MSTRDLGTHIVELHDHGTLDITGGGVRLTLPARETLELIQWLCDRKDIVRKAVREQGKSAEELLAGITQGSGEDIAAPDEIDMPEDEP